MSNFLDSERIYNKIDSIRKSKNMTIYEMAKKAGVSYSSVYKWRDKKSSPSLYLLESLCYVLDVQIINLLINDEELVYLSEEEKSLYIFWKDLRKDQKISVLALAEALNKENTKR